MSIYWGWFLELVGVGVGQLIKIIEILHLFSKNICLCKFDKFLLKKIIFV